MERDREDIIDEIYDLNQKMVEQEDYEEVKKFQKAIDNLKYILEQISEDFVSEVVINEEIVKEEDYEEN